MTIEMSDTVFLFCRDGGVFGGVRADDELPAAAWIIVPLFRF
ncbi:hypothetical protein [Actinacidiphila acididurans]|nr:hypothetical protein [Actinacidiphila acididurans]